MIDNDTIVKNFSVLYVEDEADAREELAQFLSRRVKTLYTAADGKQGLEQFIEHRPDIIVTDILMPMMNGLDMAHEIKQISPDTPILITTAFNEADFFLRAIELGIDKYVLKPIKAQKFLTSLVEIAWLLQAQKQLKLSATVFNASADAIAVTDPNNNIVAVNPAFTRITGYGSDEVLGFNPKILSSGRQDKAFYQAMWQDLNRSRHWQGEIWNRRKSGEIFPEWLSISVVADDDDKVIFHVAIFSDITKRKEAEQKLYHLAHYDPLTRLPNRTLLQDRLQQAIILAERDQSHCLSLLFIDLDRFKYVNDIYGHMTGDILLQQVAERIKGCVRGSDTVSRQGGDEFVVLLPQLESKNAAVTVAQHIIHVLEQPFTIQDLEIRIGSSIGISLYPDNGLDVDNLIKTADAAMYAVKETGRNNFRFFHEEMNVRLLERIALENALRCALTEQQFALLYQPLFDLESGKIEAVEAMLRWNHPNGQVLEPPEFMPLAEETGFVVMLSWWVMRTAMSQIKQLQGANGSRLAISVSVKQLNTPDFIKQLTQLMNSLQFDPRDLDLEIAEHALLNASEANLATLRQLHELGIGIAINDFGFGYASLLHLNYLPIARLRIDRSFVAYALQNRDSFASINAITAMANSLSLKVTIGDLDHTQQVDLLQQQISANVLVQGYQFCSPLPIEQLQLQFKE
jgi:diguanylate cyclase (GGDEF)-like protein/PAS domain S-box-containing protein